MTMGLDTNETKREGIVGGLKEREAALNHIAKSGCKEAAEVEVRYKDGKGNIWRDRVQGGRVNESRCIKNSQGQVQRIRERTQEMTGSRRDKTLAISGEDWDRIFGKKATA